MALKKKITWKAQQEREMRDKRGRGQSEEKEKDDEMVGERKKENRTPGITSNSLESPNNLHSSLFSRILYILRFLLRF